MPLSFLFLFAHFGRQPRLLRAPYLDYTHNETTQIVAQISGGQTVPFLSPSSVDPGVRDAIHVSVARTRPQLPFSCVNISWGPHCLDSRIRRHRFPNSEGNPRLNEESALLAHSPPLESGTLSEPPGLVHPYMRVCTDPAANSIHLHWWTVRCTAPRPLLTGAAKRSVSERVWAAINILGAEKFAILPHEMYLERWKCAIRRGEMEKIGGAYNDAWDEPRAEALWGLLGRVRGASLNFIWLGSAWRTSMVDGWPSLTYQRFFSVVLFIEALVHACAVQRAALGFRKPWLHRMNGNGERVRRSRTTAGRRRDGKKLPLYVEYNFIWSCAAEEPQ
ncbi:hypothetical protein C8R47DRAFT_1068171 [Mycena vitilis]|nr:hypothetical protein C8R47DRAFT_1068171 [Mycena vitilis]